MKQTIIYILYCFLLCGYSQIEAQQLVNVDSTGTKQDTSLVANKKDEGAFKKLFRGKPGKAALYGLIIPGGGQVYNKKYFSAAIAIGVDVGLLVYTIDTYRYFKLLDNAYLCLLNETGCEGIPTFGQTDAAIFKSPRNSTRQRLEYAYMYMTLGHLTTVLWAYVQAHLMDFDDSEDLSIRFDIFPNTPVPGFITPLTPSYGIAIPLYTKNKKLSDYRLVEP